LAWATSPNSLILYQYISLLRIIMSARMRSFVAQRRVLRLEGYFIIYGKFSKNL